jgi:putative SOS response-associated peptidase YedK
MCNLCRMSGAPAEAARLFSAQVGQIGNAGGDVYPGYTGLVLAEGELRNMVWGFPLVLKGKSGQKLEPKPINNARADKLDSFMWRYSFEERRCLIPVMEFAEAEGSKGSKTRTWFSVPDEPIFAMAGIWRETPQWGAAYSMVMTEACIHIAGVHDRMPVILHRADWEPWTNGPSQDAVQSCQPYSGMLAVRPTADLWVQR